jgi:uncharacterized protein (TIGR03437 family)
MHACSGGARSSFLVDDLGGTLSAVARSTTSVGTAARNERNYHRPFVIKPTAMTQTKEWCGSRAVMKSYALLTFIALLPPLAAADLAYFQIGDVAGDSIIVRVHQAAAIQKARDVLAGRSGALVMIGKVVPVPAFYNPGWNFHVDPLTVEFAESAIEVCDSSIGGVERGLNNIGGSFLPGFRWCPWTAKILAELPMPDEAAQHATHVSAADDSELALAPGSIAAAFGTGLISETVVSVALTDRTGGQFEASLLKMSPGRVNYLLPDRLAPGPVIAAITTRQGHQCMDSLYVQLFAPSLFAITPPGVAAAWVTRLRADGSTSVEPVSRFDSETQTIVATPIDLGPTTDQVYLNLIGTGIRNRPDPGAIQIILGAYSAPVLYAGPQFLFSGVDQISVLLPHVLAGSGTTAASISSILPGQLTLQSEAVQLVFR